MRRSASFVVTCLLLALTTPVLAAPRDEEVSRARVLDQQGVRAYKEGRYNDAIRYFSEAFKLGGPASELWNIAKCHLRLDEPEQASDAYDRYLMQQGLTPQDKAEAREELEELRRRKSILTVASAPSRALVYVDGKRAEPAGTTPFSVQLPPGFHKIDIELAGYKTFTKDFDAKFGRAIIVDAQLERDPNQPLTAPPPGGRGTGTPGTPTDKPTEAPETPGEFGGPKHFTAKAELGVVFSKLGTLPSTAHPAFTFSASYWILDNSHWAVGAGLLLHVTSDSWTNTINADPQPDGCTLSITNNESATELAGYGIGSLAYRIIPRLRVGLDAGLGLAAYTPAAVGGDVFYPTCQPSTGAQLAARTALEVSYSFLPYLRGTLTPIAMQVHPSYSGVRSTPLDATGAWTRIGFGLGVALDL
jgi:tetratricopeptide (TPR) repeat protein